MEETRNVYESLVGKPLGIGKYDKGTKQDDVMEGVNKMTFLGKWSHEWAMLGLAMVGRIAIASSLTLLQVASSELLPLTHRQLGIFSCVTFARICLLSAPFIGSLVSFFISR
jgi:hypothetical protein